MLADNISLFMGGCTSMEKNKNDNRKNYMPCSFAIKCKHSLKPWLAWTGSAGPQPSNTAPEAVIPHLGHKVATFHRCSSQPGCAPSRTNVYVSLQSFLISFLTIWQDFLILLGWPFQDFVLNPFFKIPLICCVEERIQWTPQDSRLQRCQPTALLKTGGWKRQECPQQPAPYITLQAGMLWALSPSESSGRMLAWPRSPRMAAQGLRQQGEEWQQDRTVNFFRLKVSPCYRKIVHLGKDLS